MLCYVGVVSINLSSGLINFTICKIAILQLGNWWIHFNFPMQQETKQLQLFQPSLNLAMCPPSPGIATDTDTPGDGKCEITVPQWQGQEVRQMSSDSARHVKDFMRDLGCEIATLGGSGAEARVEGAKSSHNGSTEFSHLPQKGTLPILLTRQRCIFKWCPQGV